MQYEKLGWISAQNYILEIGNAEKRNSLNIYRQIIDADTPSSLLSSLADKIVHVLNTKEDVDKLSDDEVDEIDDESIYKKYHHFFKIHNF